MIINKTINKVINNTDSESEALLDLTADTVAPENLLLNKTAHNRDGEGILGTMNSGGTSDYDELSNKPSINSHILTGNKTGSQLGLQNRVLASALNIGGQTIGSVEGALSALNTSKSDLVNGKVPVNELPVYTPVIGSIQSIGGMLPPSNPGDEDKYFRADGSWAKPSGGGGGTSDYDDLSNRPKINNITLTGNKTGSDLGLQNIALSSTMTIGGQTITEVEPALHALNNKPSGGGGSKITISTSETSLKGKTVTVTGTSETKTATIGNDGKATIDGFMDTGTVTISASDGTETASVTISIPYFGNYAVSLSFWAATLSITTDSPDLYGQTITVKDSNLQTVATSVFSGQGTATATVNATGTYTVSATGDGVTVTENVTVSAETTYSVSLHLWTATVSISTSSSELYSATITVKKGGSTVGSTSFSAQGTATYNAHETGTYTFECTYGGQTYSDSVTVSAETSYSVTIDTTPDGSTVTPTDDIQTWLKCANINESYTTLSQVLNDHSTLYVLINNNNAMDYMARSTSWASTVTADATAMTYIGHKNYASDVLLDDETWCAAIVGSTYKESILNTKVPYMTGATTPYGEASGDGLLSSFPAYMMFRDGETDPNKTCIVDTMVQNSWAAYKFPDAVKINGVKYSHYSSGTVPANPVHPKIQASNDNGSTWTDIGQFEVTLTNDATWYDEIVELSNDTDYQIYRIFFPEYMHQASVGGTYMTTQFYGRTDVAENVIDIYSAASDTVYYMDNGSPVTVCTTDTTGHGTVAKSSLPAGTYTLYSTVNQTSKAVVITDSTLEIDLT